MKNNNYCLHCHAETSFSQNNFCCMGCKSAYNLINKLNLKDYYDYCSKLYNKVPMKVEELKNELSYHDLVKYNKDQNLNEINLLVQGVQCGSCIWLIENTLKQQPDVENSRVNISTQRLSLSWKGEKNKIDEYVSVIQKLGYRLIPPGDEGNKDEEERKETSLLKCIAISGFATVQLMMIVMGIWFAEGNGSMGEHTKNLLHLFAMIVAVPCIAYSGLPFFKSAYEAIKAKRNNMDVPISIGIIAATLVSIWEYTRGGLYTYFDSASMLIFALLIGRYLDIKSRNKAKEKARGLILSQARVVTIASDEGLRLLPINKVNVGDIISVSVGEKVPVDGVVVEGKSEVDNSIITGETLPIAVDKGDYIYSGSINLLAPIKVEIKKLGEATILGEIIKLMENAEQGRAKYVRIADKVAKLYTPIVLFLSLITLLGWVLYGANINDAILNAVAVLIITCPCALGLAVPVVQIVASSRMMNGGILVKSPDALERLSEVNTVVFDKTGTLTLGKPKLVNPDEISNEDMKLISSMAALSKHPLCVAVKAEFPHDLFALEVHEEKGMGLESNYNGEVIRLGNKAWCEVKDNLDSDIYSEMWFRKGNNEPIRLKFADQIREEAKVVIDRLKKDGYVIWMLSGDRREVVEHVAKELGIDKFKAEHKPSEKYAFLEELEQQGKLTLMVGDGLNDSPALRKAHASISPSTAIDISQNSADIVFQTSLKAIVESLNVAKRSDALVKQNFILSFAYNVISIPIAALGMITPLIAAIAMSLSSICVIMNSLRLKKREVI